MRAVLIERFGVAPTVHEVPEPVCGPDAVVVRVEATGLCRSDWHVLMGHDPDVALPHVPGHEFAGVVHQVGERVTGWALGDRVIAPFVNACGSCPQCQAGEQQVCAAQTQPGFSRWGSFAELVTVEAAAINLVALPDAVDAATAAGLGCRFATAYRAVVEVARVTAGEWVAVHGCGGVGLSAVMIARVAGARVVAVDVSGPARALAVGFGAEAVVDAAGPDGPLAWDRVAAQVRAVAGGGVQVSLD
ncbi:MAG TPA: alcohol dehydrogenase catalytic domain-containing protein, partial [Kineosporiaceae bacterium]|nr:alcohol dehydrogenase catalytic domain-containing protein [Kineosporiaceae bacterium]